MPYKADIDSFVRGGDGAWRWSAGGGSDWRFGWTPRPDGTGIALEGMGSGGNGHPFVAPGVAGSAVETVVVRGDGWEVTSPTEARTGGFLIGADLDESIDLAALDASGQELFSITNSTIWVAASELR